MDLSYSNEEFKSNDSSEVCLKGVPRWSEVVLYAIAMIVSSAVVASYRRPRRKRLPWFVPM